MNGIHWSNAQPASDYELDCVAQAFGFHSALHMERVASGAAPSAFEEAHQRESRETWKLEDRAWAARQAVARLGERRKPRVRQSRSKAQRARRARERAARLAS